MPVNEPEHAVEHHVRRQISKLREQMMALENALQCDAYQAEIDSAYTTATRVEDAAHDLLVALRDLEGPDDDD